MTDLLAHVLMRMAGPAPDYERARSGQRAEDEPGPFD